ncbi:MAG: TRAP transporter large permease subunit [Peptococcaceae bacterium]|nr:TRAP transporter large permease subunit [Peptococcaceae bacterium]
MTEAVATNENKKKQSPLQWLDENFESIFLVGGMLAIIFLITWQVGYRYIFTKFTSGASTMVAAAPEEIARYIFVWISYLAVPVAIKKRDLIRVDIIYDKLPARIQKMSWVIVDACMLIWAGVITYEGAMQITRLMKFVSATPVLNIPFWMLYLVLPIAFGLCILRTLQDIVKQMKECGVKDTAIALVFGAVLCIPLILPVKFPTIAVLFGYFVIFLALGVPISMSLGIASIFTIWMNAPIAMSYVGQLSFASIDKTAIMCIPFFVASGDLMGVGGLSRRLFAMADEFLGSAYGGLALATVVTCVLFGAMSGSGPATVAAIGALCVPAMVERGYDQKFSAAIVACAGAIGVLIPPSNPFVVYAISANVSVGKLFMAGILPGLLVAAVLMAYSYWKAKQEGWRGEERPRTAKTKLAAVWESKWALMVPVIILGGIYGGFMTPTEAAAVGAFYGLIVGVFIHKEITLKNLIPAMIGSACTSSMIIVLMAMAQIFGSIMSIERIPTMVANFILGLTSSKILILMLINILLLIVGTFMEALAAIIILVPLLLPIVTPLGVDPVHFGVIMVLNLAIGFITPPVGVNLFVASGISGVKLADIAKAALPMLGLMILVLLVVTYFPPLSMFLTQFVK